MRQTKLLLLSFLSVLLCPLALKAQDGQTINNYTVDFNTSINTSDHNFIVAKGNTSLKACRAYFVPTDPQDNYNYEFDTQAYIETGIENVDAEAEKSEDVIYNLQGIRVS